MIARVSVRLLACPFDKVTDKTTVVEGVVKQHVGLCVGGGKRNSQVKSFPPEKSVTTEQVLDDLALGNCQSAMFSNESLRDIPSTLISRFEDAN